MKSITREKYAETREYALPLLAILICILSIWVSVHSRIISHNSEDDIHFLYYSASTLVNHEQHHEMVETVSNFLKSAPEAGHYSFRYDERQRVTRNYPLMTYIFSGVRSVFADDFTKTNVSYAEVIANIYNVSLHIISTLIPLIFIFVLYAARRDYWLGIALGLIVLLSIDWFFPWKAPLWILHARPQGFSEVIERALQAISLIFTASGLDSFFPRSHFLFLTIPVFFLRWSGRNKSAYALAAFTCIVHLSMGAVLLLCLVATDLLIRRENLQSFFVIMVISVSMAWFSSLGILTDTQSLTSMPIIIGIATLIAGALFLLTKYFGVFVPLFINRKILQPISSTGPIASDLIILYAFWIALVPLSMAMYFIVGEPRNAWTWGALPGRYLMTMRGPLLIGLAILFSAYLLRKNINLKPTLAIGSLIIGIMISGYALNKPAVFAIEQANFKSGLLEREQTAIRAANGEPYEYIEADVYFSIARAIDLNLPFPSGLLNFTPNTCYRRQYICEPFDK